MAQGGLAFAVRGQVARGGPQALGKLWTGTCPCECVCYMRGRTIVRAQVVRVSRTWILEEQMGTGDRDHHGYYMEG